MVRGNRLIVWKTCITLVYSYRRNQRAGVLRRRGRSFLATLPETRTTLDVVQDRLALSDMRSCWKTEREPEDVEVQKKEVVCKALKEVHSVQGILEDTVVLEDVHERNIFVTSSKSLLFCSVSHVTNNLLLSSATAADSSNLDYLKVTCVINATAELPDTPMKNLSVKYHKIPINDNATCNILCHLDYTSDTIHNEIRNGGRILVHCVAGISRSATICIAYLMKYYKKTLLEAYKHVKARRSIIKPNCGFFRQLIVYEKSLFGKTTVRMVYNESVPMEIPDVYSEDYKNVAHFRRKRRSDVIRRH